MRLRHLLAIVTVVMVGAPERVVRAQASDFTAASLESTSTAASGAGRTSPGVLHDGEPPPPVGATAVAAGEQSTCVVTASGGVQCWGQNTSGQLGDGTSVSRGTPTDVSGLTSGVVAVAAGSYHTCAVTSGGGVKCWGYNGSGALGDGTTTQRTSPVDVTGLASGVVAVAGGRSHTCALTSGGVKCWGNNGNGQLGDGTTTQRTTPVDVTGLTTGVVALAAGSYHSCAVTSGGGVKCWGGNEVGQLGDGTTTQRSTPVDVTGLTSGVVAVAAEYYHTCAVTSGGGARCWGANWYGQLGDGTRTQRLTPVDVSGLTAGVVALTTGSDHTCALIAGGGAKCWGNNVYGQLGDGTTTTRTTAVDVTGLSSGVLAVAAGLNHTCALTSSGGVKCWGDNSSGQLGDGRVLSRMWPVNALGFGATVTLTNINHVYDGTPKPVTVTTTPSGLAVTVTYTGIGGTTYGPNEVAPSGVGTYAAFANVTDAGYSGSGSATATLTVATATPVITWANPAAIMCGTALSAAQLNATANVAGTFAYTPPTGTVLAVGTHTLSVTFTPTDTVNYAVATKVVTIDVIGAFSDFTGDGKSDLLWRHATHGDMWLWAMNGTAAPTENYVGTVETNWQIRSVGDQDGDGKADLLWRHALTGALYFWRMEGGVVAADLYVGTVPIAYDIVGTGDYDGDGKADLLWRHTTQGDMWLWRMNGATQLSDTYVGTVPVAYQIVR